MTFSEAMNLWNLVEYQQTGPSNGLYIFDNPYTFNFTGKSLILGEPSIANSTKIGRHRIEKFIRSHLAPHDVLTKSQLTGKTRYARLENDHLIFYEGLKFLLRNKDETCALVLVTSDCDILLTAMQLAELFPSHQVWIYRQSGGQSGYISLPADKVGAICNKFVFDMMNGSSDYWSNPNTRENNDLFAKIRCKTPKRAVSRPPCNRPKPTDGGELCKLSQDIPADLDGNDAVNFELAERILKGEYTLPLGHDLFFWSRNLCTCFRAGKFSVILQICFKSVKEVYQSFDRVVYAQTQPLSTLLLGVAFVYLRYVGIAFRYIPEDFIQVFENDGLGNLRIEGPNSRPGDFVVPAQAVVCAIRPNSMNIIEERLCRAYSEVTGVTVDTLDYSIMTAICQVFLPQSLLSLKDACQYVDPDTCRPLITKASSDTDVVRAIIDAKPFLHYIKPQIRQKRMKPFTDKIEFDDWWTTVPKPMN